MPQFQTVLLDVVGIVGVRPIRSYSEVTRCAVRVAMGMAACESCSDAAISKHVTGMSPSAGSMCSLYPREYCWQAALAAGLHSQAAMARRTQIWAEGEGRPPGGV